MNTTLDDTLAAHSEDFYVSSESRLLDLTWTTNTLLAQYWGHWRTHEIIAESIRNSLCYGLYHRTPAKPESGPIGHVDRQVGFARVVTDYATFSWLCDVVVDEAFRRRGLGRFLVAQIVRDSRIAKTVMLLGTRDAHTFYARFGFACCTQMKRIPKD